MRRRVKYARVIPAFILIAVLLIGSVPTVQQNRAAYTFVDVGQGDCLHIRTPDGRNYLMDGGGKSDYNVGRNVLAPYLLKNGVRRLDGIFVSHLHTDHVKGLAEIAEIIDVGAIYVYDGYKTCPEAVALAFESGGGEVDSGGGNLINRLRFVAAGDTVLLGGSSGAEILFPERRGAYEYQSEAAVSLNADDENKNSIIVRFVNRGISVLMTGDISKEGEAAVTAVSDISCDILKIAHHGSKYSTSENLFIAANPALAVIQVGKNSFGHPTAEALETISNASVPVYRNDEEGAILIYPYSGGFKVKTVKRDYIPKLLRWGSE
jgi:competence protein ComEC